VKSLEESRMSLGEHLAELRSRLLRLVIVGFLLSGVGLLLSESLFGLLVRPVLEALPRESGALVFTSAIEEFNIFLKVGIYAGLCLATPVALWELWGFVAPGLHAQERRLAAPFVLAGTLAFLAGTVFCYLVLLPPMFNFLLADSAQDDRAVRLQTARWHEQNALGFLRGADPAGADAALERAVAELEGLGVTAARESWLGRKPTQPLREDVELGALLEGTGQAIDALEPAQGEEAQVVWRAALQERGDAIEAFGRRDFARARSAAESSFAALSRAAGLDTATVDALLELHVGLARATALHRALNWTQPMLSMSEQLSLILVLEIATGAIFELPVVMALLGLVGILESAWLMRYQRHAILLVIVVAAVATPTSDPVNLMLMAGPLLVCFELGVLMVWLAERRRARAAGQALVGPP
jgi:sec-independent protein translocase protein TatC